MYLWVMMNALSANGFYQLFTTVSLWLLLVTNALAQRPDASFEGFTTDQGLASDYITAILKDRRGFLWVGTSNGLNRFDGLTFKTFRHQNSTGIERPGLDGLLGNYIVNSGLTEDKAGFLWVATNRGLYRFDPVSEQFRGILIPPLRDGQADNDYVSPLRFDRQGFGWFSSKYQLYRLDPRTLQLTAYPLPAVIDNAYAEPYFDRAGRFWINQAGNLYRFDPETGHYRRSLAWINNRADSWVHYRTFYEDSKSPLLAVGDRGVWQYDARQNRFVPYPPFPQTEVLDMRPDRLSNGEPFWWMGGGKTGLWAYVPATKQQVEFSHHADDRLSHNSGIVMNFYRDPQTGVLWLGTDQGLEKLDPFAIKFGRTLLTQATENGRRKAVAVVRQDNRDENSYWLAVYETGLVHWNRQTSAFQVIPLGKAPERRHALDLAQDRRGRVWVAMHGGVGRYDPATGRIEFINAFLPEAARFQDITVTYSDRQGRIWIGSRQDGLYWYDPTTERIQPWLLPISDGLGIIRRVQEDSRGHIWTLTGRGLYQLDPSTRQTRHIGLYGAPIKPTDRLQSTFSIDHRDQLWLSGIGFVACADTTGRIQQTYTLANGLQAEHIFSVIEDKRGHIWLATDNLLHELNPKTGRFTYYDKGSGLIEKMVFGPGEMTLNRQGELFIDYLGGFNFVQPSQLRRNAAPPPVVITNWRVNNVPRPVAKSIVLHPGETTLTLTFAALNFSQPDKNQYAYQLVGFNDDWTPTNDRTATYTNLEPGDYTFRVKAANNDGVWNPTGASVVVQVLPAYWQTGWFRLLCVALVVGFLYAIYRYRESQRQRLEGIRNRIATDLHDDMGSTLSSIRIFSDVVQQQIAPVRPEAVPVLQRISMSATTLSESMQDIIWTIDTKNDTLADLVTRMREFGLKLAEAKGIAFQMQVGDSFNSLRLNVEQRRNLYLIFKESVNNAVKYAQASRIDVSLGVTGKQLRLLIQDNGQGFDPAAVRLGNGLPNLQKRAAEIRGKLELTSAPGQGTTIELIMKM